MAPSQIHVAAGAIEDARGRVLVARRPDDTHQGGLWEFPGGKLDPGESHGACLARELWEELGIRVRSSCPLIRIHHDYGDRHILLDVHRVTSYSGEPVGREGQPLAWLAPDAMDPAAFPAADRPIIMALRLPPLYLITGADPSALDAFLGRLAAALGRGVRLVQLRAPGLPPAAYARLAEAAFGLCEAAGARLILNADPDLVRALPAHGLHLTAARLWAKDRPTLVPGGSCGASCHDARDLNRAADLGLDYALLAPVQPTATHPGAQPLGWPRFAELADRAALPVYALGGLGIDDLDRAIRSGAQGIAAIRGLWEA
ncbi:MAG TPA: Nudix family hydrolase [Chromatiaceae bacterium]|nr:Nudix family hydrolase [Chromatiaceae bacterium]